MASSSTLKPRPDPAIADADCLGLRAHRHPADRLHAWVYLQHQVWVDYWGNEHEIESMPLDYVENVIRFSEERVERIAFLISLDVLIASGHLLLGREDSSQRTFEEARGALNSCAEEGASISWLHSLPLLRALDRRAGAGGAGSDG